MCRAKSHPSNAHLALHAIRPPLQEQPCAEGPGQHTKGGTQQPALGWAELRPHPAAVRQKVPNSWASQDQAVLALQHCTSGEGNNQPGRACNDSHMYKAFSAAKAKPGLQSAAAGCPRRTTEMQAHPSAARSESAPLRQRLTSQQPLVRGAPETGAHLSAATCKSARPLERRVPA